MIKKVIFCFFQFFFKQQQQQQKLQKIKTKITIEETMDKQIDRLWFVKLKLYFKVSFNIQKTMSNVYLIKKRERESKSEINCWLNDCAVYWSWFDVCLSLCDIEFILKLIKNLIFSLLYSKKSKKKR